MKLVLFAVNVLALAVLGLPLVLILGEAMPPRSETAALAAASLAASAAGTWLLGAGLLSLNRPHPAFAVKVFTFSLGLFVASTLARFLPG